MANRPALSNQGWAAHNRLGVCDAMMWMVLHAPVGPPIGAVMCT